MVYSVWFGIQYNKSEQLDACSFINVKCASFPSPSPPSSPFPLRPLQPLLILHKPTHHLPRFPQPRQYACLKRVSITVHRDQLVIVHFPIAQVGHFAGVVGREGVQEGHHGRVVHVVHRAKNGCVWVLGREFQECTDVLMAGVCCWVWTVVVRCGL